MDRIRKTVLKTKGVQDWNVDKQKELVTVKGTMDVDALAKALKKKLHRKFEIVPPKKEKDGDVEGGENGGSGGGRKKKNKGSNGGGDGGNEGHAGGGRMVDNSGYIPDYPGYGHPGYGYGYGHPHLHPQGYGYGHAYPGYMPGYPMSVHPPHHTFNYEKS
ncbi:hypothetical protein DITRI_Ditri05aG0013100 [Diplodiscus trichospermus]